MIYDRARLDHEAREEIATRGVFVEPNLVVVPEVTRAAITAAMTTLAATDFAAPIPDPE